MPEQAPQSSATQGAEGNATRGPEGSAEGHTEAQAAAQKATQKAEQNGAARGSTGGSTQRGQCGQEPTAKSQQRLLTARGAAATAGCCKLPRGRRAGRFISWWGYQFPPRRDKKPRRGQKNAFDRTLFFCDDAAAGGAAIPPGSCGHEG